MARYNMSVDKRRSKQRIFFFNREEEAKFQEIVVLCGATSMTETMRYLLDLGYAHLSGTLSMDVDGIEETKAMYIRTIIDMRKELLTLNCRLMKPRVTGKERSNLESKMKQIKFAIATVNEMMKLEYDTRGIMDIKSEISAGLKQEEVDLKKEALEHKKNIDMIDRIDKLE